MYEETYDDGPEIVVGLDIGTTKVVAVVGQRDEQTGLVKILGYGKTESVGVVKGSVRNIDQTTKAVQAAVEEASRVADVTIKEVYVGIAGQNIKCERSVRSFVRKNQDDVITRKEIEDLKQNDSRCSVEAGKVIVHVIPLAFTVDGVSDLTEDDVVGMPGSKVELIYNVITADRLALKNIYRSVKNAGLDVVGFILEPLVSAEAVLDSNDKEAGVILVDIGGGTTDLAIFLDGVLHHTAVIPLAGNSITHDIYKGCSVLRKQAEALKVRFGSALVESVAQDKMISIPSVTNTAPNKEISLTLLATIINARVKEIFEAVHGEINACGIDQNNFIGGVVLTGGGAKLRHIEKSCQYNVRLDARLGIPSKHINPDTPKELVDPIYATAIGLVLYGIRSAEEKRLLHIPAESILGLVPADGQDPVTGVQSKTVRLYGHPGMAPGVPEDTPLPASSEASEESGNLAQNEAPVEEQEEGKTSNKPKKNNPFRRLGAGFNRTLQIFFDSSFEEE